MSVIKNQIAFTQNRNKIKSYGTYCDILLYVIERKLNVKRNECEINGRIRLKYRGAHNF